MKFKIMLLLMKYFTHREMCVFKTGYCKVSVVREWNDINFVKSNGTWQVCKELRGTNYSGFQINQGW